MGRTHWGPGFNDVLRWAKRQATFKFRSVRGLTLAGNAMDGLCLQHKNGTYTIQLDQKLSRDAAVPTLLHEVAHVVTMRKYGWPDRTSDHHDERWGREYSRLYNDYLEWLGD